jgi:hypothetical protein
MACDSAVYGTSAVWLQWHWPVQLSYRNLSLCRSVTRALPSVRNTGYGLTTSRRSTCPLPLQKPTFQVVVQRNSNYTIWRMFSNWGFEGHKTKGHHHIKCSSCNHLQCHSFPTQSLTLWHNFPNWVQFENFCGSSNLNLAFANTHDEPLLLPHFSGLGDLPNRSSVSGISSSTRCPFTSALDVFGRRTPSSPWTFSNARHSFLTFCALTHLKPLALIAWGSTSFGHNIRTTLPACRSNCTSTYPLNSIWVTLAQAVATYPYHKYCYLLKSNITYSYKTTG